MLGIEIIEIEIEPQLDAQYPKKVLGWWNIS